VPEQTEICERRRETGTAASLSASIAGRGKGGLVEALPRCGWAAGPGTGRGRHGLLDARRRPREVGYSTADGKTNRALFYWPTRPCQRHAVSMLPRQLAGSRQLDRLVPSRRAGRLASPAVGGAALPPWPWLVLCAARTTCGWALGSVLAQVTSHMPNKIVWSDETAAAANGSLRGIWHAHRTALTADAKARRDATTAHAETEEGSERCSQEKGVPGAGHAVDEAVDAVAGDAPDAHDLLGDGHVDGLQRGQRVALDLDGPAVLALPAHRAHVALEHRHVVPLAPRRQREHQPADAAAGHQHPGLLLPPRLARGRGRGSDGRVGRPH
jgi:hypothetical protein